MQGFNMGRYVPAEHEGVLSGNQLQGKKPRGGGNTGATTVRFEMPFAIWCASCPQPTLIGQGVRFNAEKRRVGAYLSTPLWSFRFKHADCGGAIEVRTDPKNTAYVVVSGGSRRDYGHADDDDDERPEAVAERNARRNNAFASLEKTIADRKQLRQADERIVGLLEASARHWRDPYFQNQRLRHAFRAGRHRREADAAADDDLRQRLDLAADMTLAPADDAEDAKRAAAVEFGRRDVDDDADDKDGAGGTQASCRALYKPLFAASVSMSTSSSDTDENKHNKRPRCPQRTSASSSSLSASSSSSSSSFSPSFLCLSSGMIRKKKPNLLSASAAARRCLVSEIVSHTRAAHDPFLRGTCAAPDQAGFKPALLPSSPLSRWPVVRGKRPAAAPDGQSPSLTGPTDGGAGDAGGAGGVGLVQYDSD